MGSAGKISKISKMREISKANRISKIRKNKCSDTIRYDSRQTTDTTHPMRLYSQNNPNPIRSDVNIRPPQSDTVPSDTTLRNGKKRYDTMLDGPSLRRQLLRCFHL